MSEKQTTRQALLASDEKQSSVVISSTSLWALAHGAIYSIGHSGRTMFEMENDTSFHVVKRWKGSTRWTYDVDASRSTTASRISASSESWEAFTGCNFMWSCMLVDTRRFRKLLMFRKGDAVDDRKVISDDFVMSQIVHNLWMFNTSFLRIAGCHMKFESNQNTTNRCFWSLLL